jgi:hypothetical protein
VSPASSRSLIASPPLRSSSLRQWRFCESPALLSHTPFLPLLLIACSCRRLQLTQDALRSLDRVCVYVIDVLRKLSAVLVALIAVAGAVIYGFVTSKLHNHALDTERATIIDSYVPPPLTPFHSQWKHMHVLITLQSTALLKPQ